MSKNVALIFFWVFLAAHCINPTNERLLLERDITIALGGHDFSKPIEVGRTYVGVESIHLHDTWNPSTPEFDGDIAVIKLAESMKSSYYIRPVCLATEKQSYLINGIVVGWGVYDDNIRKLNVPRKVNIPIVKDRECFKKDKTLAEAIWDEAFCAGREGAGICEGDSGSGFYVENDGKFYLRGIVSSSVMRECSQTHMGLYSDVSKYLKFLGKVKINNEK